MKPDVADYDLIVLGYTNRAVRVKADDDGEPFWLPLSQVEVDDNSTGLCAVPIPDWLAEERGLA